MISITAPCVPPLMLLPSMTTIFRGRRAGIRVPAGKKSNGARAKASQPSSGKSDTLRSQPSQLENWTVAGTINSVALPWTGCGSRAFTRATLVRHTKVPPSRSADAGQAGTSTRVKQMCRCAKAGPHRIGVHGMPAPQRAKRAKRRWCTTAGPHRIGVHGMPARRPACR